MKPNPQWTLDDDLSVHISKVTAPRPYFTILYAWNIILTLVVLWIMYRTRQHVWPVMFASGIPTARADDTLFHASAEVTGYVIIALALLTVLCCTCYYCCFKRIWDFLRKRLEKPRVSKVPKLPVGNERVEFTSHSPTKPSRTRFTHEQHDNGEATVI